MWYCFNDILLTVALTDINIVYRLAQLRQRGLQFKIREQNIT